MEDNFKKNENGETPVQKLAIKKNLFARKRYSHYIFEFALVFLAVVFGFLAESYREYLTDRSKEKVYIRGLIENLEDDIWQLEEIIELNRTKLLFLDTASQMRSQKWRGPDYYRSLNRVISKGIYKNHFFKSNDAIITEMKFTGKLTLLPREVLDSLNMYEQRLFEVYKEEVQYEHHSLQSIEFFLTLTDDWRYFTSTMTANDKELKFIINQCVNVESAAGHYNRLLIIQKTTATRLINYLRKKYALNDSKRTRPLRHQINYY